MNDGKIGKTQKQIISGLILNFQKEEPTPNALAY